MTGSRQGDGPTAGRALGLFDASAGIGWRTWTPAAAPSWRDDAHAMDPAALTSADVLAILDLLHVYYEAAAIK